MSTPKYNIGYISEGQTGAATAYNDGMNRVVSLTNMRIEDRNLSSPPGSPTTGSVYLVKATGSGVWTGQSNNLAVYYAGWIFIVPTEGLIAWIANENKRILFDGSVWIDMPQEGVAVANLGLTVNSTYSQSQVQSIADKVDALLNSLRNADSIHT